MKRGRECMWDKLALQTVYTQTVHNAKKILSWFVTFDTSSDSIFTLFKPSEDELARTNIQEVNSFISVIVHLCMPRDLRISHN